MTNIIAFNRPAPAPVKDSRAQLMRAFAQDRRAETDVFWLKENAELLGIFASSGFDLPSDSLAPYQSFYDDIEETLQFYPQYYRFLLSICLDLEALGLPGDKAQKLCDWVSQKGYAEAELSDLQRAEARRLLHRRGASIAVADGSLGARLHRFIDRSATFAMPNKKAAYELTHIVFYLSEYGKTDPGLNKDAMTSLEFAGVLAYLDQNIDLLAEVCTAILFAGGTPSPIWTEAVTAFHREVYADAADVSGSADAYHEFFVTGWASNVLGAPAFDAPMPDGPITFYTQQDQAGALRSLSTCLSDMGPARSGEWVRMRGHVLSYLGELGHDVLLHAEQSTNMFDAFFEGFARAARV